MSEKLSLRSLPIKGSRVLMRVDFNVPLDDHANITSDSRLVAALPSIKYVLEGGGSLVLMSHLGRPKGERKPEFSLRPVAKRLSELLDQDVMMAPDCIGEEVEALAETLKPGQVMLLENLRYYAAEEKPDKDPSFAQQLAKLGDLYVNDAFGTAHRVHSSTVTVASYFPSKAAAGFLMEKEIQFLGDAILKPQRPFYAIIGGSKVSTKIGVIKSLMKKVDALFIGGGMIFTFAKAQGISIGDSIFEADFLDTAKEILKACQSENVPMYFPDDVVAADAFSNDANIKVVSMSEGIPKGYRGLDVGPETIKLFSSKLSDAATILWNGPLGVFEFSNFAKGSVDMAKVLATLPATVIVGGGDTLAVVDNAGVTSKMSHLSTGGGACLEYLEYGSLPAVEALAEKTV